MILPKFPRIPGAQKNPTQSQTIPRSNVQHGYCKSFDDTRIFYSVEGSGPPLVFCYGLVCSSLHWTYQIDYFSKHYTCIWFDYRGHHNTDVPDDLNTLTIESIAMDLGEVIKQLELPPAVFLGHSMGVNIVLEFYRQNPEAFAGMVLANGTARRPLETLFNTNATQLFFEGLRRVYELSPSVMNRIWKAQAKSPLTEWIVAQSGFNPHLASREDIRQYIEQVISLDPRILLYLIKNYETFDATPWLHQVHVPSLVIGGDLDRMTPLQEQELMHQLIPKSSLEVIRHGSHCSQLDLPTQVNLVIEKFLQENQIFQKSEAPG